MSFLLLLIWVVSLPLERFYLKNLSLRLYPLNHPYAVLYSKVVPQGDLSSVVTWSTRLKSSGPQNRHSSSQCANHGVLSFSSTKCSSRPAPVLWTTTLAMQMNYQRGSKAPPACLLRWSKQGCSRRMLSRRTRCFSLFGWLEKKQQSDKPAVPYSIDVWFVQRGACRDDGKVPSVSLCWHLLPAPNQHSSAGEAPSPQRAGSWHGALASDYQCCMGRGKHHP